MNPRDILDVATTLIAGMSEAEWRSAVSRAYYAAFHVARRLLLQCGFAVPRADQAHAYLWLRLANSGHVDVQNAGNRCSYLRGMRNWADYDLDRPFAHHPAFGQVQAAESTIQLLEAVSAEPVVRTLIRDAIKVYERDVLREVTWQR
jgi:uncharacterized protein (UPF0332 family)